MINKLLQSFELLIKTNLVNSTEIERGKHSISEMQKELNKLNLIIKKAQSLKKAPISTTKTLNQIESCLEKILQNLEVLHQIMVLTAGRHTNQQKNSEHMVN